MRDSRRRSPHSACFLRRPPRLRFSAVSLILTPVMMISHRVASGEIDPNSISLVGISGRAHNAMLMYADMCCIGYGVQQDPEVARLWWSRAAEEGNRTAAQRLRVGIYDSLLPGDDTTERHHRKAERHHRKAERHHRKAERHLRKTPQKGHTCEVQHFLCDSRSVRHHMSKPS